MSQNEATKCDMEVDGRSSEQNRSQAEIMMIPLKSIKPHPDNPRLKVDDGVIDSITGNLRRAGDYPREHAIIVRCLNGQYEIIAGHRRFIAAGNAGLTEIPCWVMSMSDQDASIRLLTTNQQSGLSLLEIGLHGLKVVQKYGRSGLTVSRFAEEIGKSQSRVTELRQGAEVYQKVQESIGHPIDIDSVSDKIDHLAAIHTAPEGYWVSLVEKTVLPPESRFNAKSVKQVVKEIKRFENCLASGAKLSDYVDKESLRAQFLGELPDTEVVNRVEALVTLSEKVSRLLGEEVTHYCFNPESREVQEEGVHNRQREFVELLLETKGMTSAEAEEELQAMVQEDEAHSRGRAEAEQLEWRAKNSDTTERVTKETDNGYVRVQKDGSLSISAMDRLTEKQQSSLIKCIENTVADFMASLA